jgi:glucokinase
MAGPILGLVGDVGGTRARFGLAEVEGGKSSIREAMTLAAADFAQAVDAVRAYLERVGASPSLAVIAAAGPVSDGVVAFTNNEAWRFDERELEAKCGLRRVRLINDFAAQALAIDQLTPDDLRRVGPVGRPLARATRAILGPGTGLGAAALVDDGSAVAVMVCEAGHADFAPTDAAEIELLRFLMKRFGRVSIERLLSGPGLLNIYQGLADQEGCAADLDHPDAITRQALAGPGLARDALTRFCALLGSFAGDFALSTGARGGVYISGGIAPAIVEFLASSPFRDRLEAKGRMRDYMKAIPTLVVAAPNVALTGAARLLPALDAAA